MCENKPFEIMKTTGYKLKLLNEFTFILKNPLEDIETGHHPDYVVYLQKRRTNTEEKQKNKQICEKMVSKPLKL